MNILNSPINSNYSALESKRSEQVTKFYWQWMQPTGLIIMVISFLDFLNFIFTSIYANLGTSGELRSQITNYKFWYFALIPIFEFFTGALLMLEKRTIGEFAAIVLGLAFIGIFQFSNIIMCIVLVYVECANDCNSQNMGIIIYSGVKAVAIAIWVIIIMSVFFNKNYELFFAGLWFISIYPYI